MPKLNPKEEDLFYTVVNGLTLIKYFTYEQNGDCIRLTEKGFDYIYDDDIVADAFRNSRVVNEARDYWYTKASSSNNLTTEVTNFRGIKRLGVGNFGLTGLFKAGIDPIEQFVGSTHNLYIKSDGYNLTYTITNVTSFRSLMYGITPECLNFYNTSQTFIITEPINFNKIHEGK